METWYWDTRLKRLKHTSLLFAIKTNAYMEQCKEVHEATVKARKEKNL
jgi:hypothetical protein